MGMILQVAPELGEIECESGEANWKERWFWNCVPPDAWCVSYNAMALGMQ